MKTQLASPEVIRKIHETSLAILEKTGVIVPHPAMLELFAAAGAKVDREKQRVRIPAGLVMKMLKLAGKKYTLYGRDIEKKAEFGMGKTNYNSIAGEALWLENPGEERRYTEFSDVAKAVRLADGLEMINICGAMSDPHGMPVSWRCVAVAAEMIRNTVKPITFWFHDRASACFIVELVTALRGGEKAAAEKPLCYPFLEPISPLSFPFDGIDLLFETSRIDMPVHIGPMAQMGMSAPCTIAGTIALENAEILAGICITQLVKKGIPVCYGGICHAFDMSSTQMIFSGPEQAIFGVLACQMGKFYGLPVYVNNGLTDSKVPDAQAGMEIAATLFAGRSAGADIFGHQGICGVDQATSLDMLVLQNEVISYVESINREVEFSAETFALKIIEEIGPKGSFLEHEHTLEHFRKELYFPRLADRNFYEPWKNKGAKDMAERVAERKKEILSSHQPHPIDTKLDQELSRIV
ncbi:MAG TPA: hypothetical protein DC049_17410, partial [Spirochaetia bacterium]|nr:hypothetical protein [Spirochaetia bacterium]